MLEQNNTIKVVVADGLPLVAEAIKTMVAAEDDMEVVAVSSSLDDAIRYTIGHKPDILVVEAPGVVTQETIGLLTEKIKQISPKTNIVMITIKSDTETIQKSLEAGVESYIVKEEAPGQLLTAIRKTAQGEAYLCPSMMMALVQSKRGDEDGLTGRELDVLKLVGYGHTNSEIGGKLHLSVRTVESHRANLQEKLGTSTRAELVREALDRGLVKAAA